MHASTMLRMKHFINNYIKDVDNPSVLDVGSYDVNGSYKNLFEGMKIKYVGLDICEGPNVDVAVKDSYDWKEIEDESFDFVISGQAFEHIEYPWLTIKEIYKKLKIGGIICIIVPSSIEEHRYPLDCYRYFGDGMAALAKWAGFEVIESVVAGIPEELVDGQWDDRSNDTLLIAVKGKINSVSKRKLFPRKRIFNPVCDLKMQNEFLSMGYRYKDYFETVVDYVRKNEYKKVYLYGDNTISSILYSTLLGMCKVDVVNTQKNWAVGGVGITVPIEVENYSLLRKDEEKLELRSDKKDLVIITEFDFHCEHKKYLKEKYVLKDFVYAYDAVDFGYLFTNINKNKPIYVFGIGNNSKLVYDRLKCLNIDIDGFVVSDNNYNIDKHLGKDVLKLSDISKEDNVIISNYKYKEIKELLENKNFTNVLEGNRIINVWKFTMESVLE